MDVERRGETLTFTGRGSEYFRIWIVNVGLTIVTLGFYSAWAKVRRLQYFYRHTRLAGTGFDYHGDPIALLRGRIISAIMFGAYTFAGQLGPGTLLTVLALLGAAFPWLIHRSLRFRMRNSSYRGIRFRFDGSVRSAYWVFLGLPFLSIFTFFLLVPFVHQRIKRYQHGHTRYGQTAFAIDADAGGFYQAYIMAALLSVGVFVALVTATLIGAFAVVLAVGRPAPGAEPSGLSFVIIVIAFWGYVIGLLLVRSLMDARLQNHVWHHTRLGSHRFSLSLGVLRLFRIRVVNLLLTLVTLGLYRPFAQINLARYLADSFQLWPDGSLDDMQAEESGSEVGAIGDEAMEMFDFDIAF